VPAIPYRVTGVKPPPASKSVGGIIENEIPAVLRDSARYLLEPDVDFARPYLAIPGGDAFVWPLGTEGFEIQDQAELGKHKYIGDIKIDVEVVHRAETNITLSGIFPGHTAVDNMFALRQIFQAETPTSGKVLHLPGILVQAQYVKCERLTNSHAEEERNQDIAYSLSMVRVGTGKDTTRPAITASTGTPTPTGAGTRTFRCTATVRTLRAIANYVYGNMNFWTRLYSISHNANWFSNRQIATHLIPTYSMPIGTVIYF
jgi:hypothetical protein